MAVDYSSLVAAAGAAAGAAGLTFLVSWVSDKKLSFLATGVVAMIGIVLSLIVFYVYTATFNKLAGYVGSTGLLVFISLSLTGAHQFSNGHFALKKSIAIAVALCVFSALPYIWGYDALSFIFMNLAAAVMLAASAREYWKCREESRPVIYSIIGLYLALAASFIPCAILIYIESPLVLSAPPKSWAEVINMVASIICVSGISALSVALCHLRLAKTHEHNAATDSLTGLLNRRALFERMEILGLPPGTAVAVFDIDRFKSINDQYGHTTGDAVLREFAQHCLPAQSSKYLCARLGGEEFVVVMFEVTKDIAMSIAEQARLRLLRRRFGADSHQFSATVSAGLFLNQTAWSLELGNAISRADEALYMAKRNGRNTVVQAEQFAA